MFSKTLALSPLVCFLNCQLQFKAGSLCGAGWLPAASQDTLSMPKGRRGDRKAVSVSLPASKQEY